MTPFTRSRASTLQDPGPDFTILQSQLDLLETDTSVSGLVNGLEILRQKVDASLQIRQLLLENTNDHNSKDTFRRLNGFQILVTSVFVHASNTWSEKSSDQERVAIIQELLPAAFGVLSAALQDHKGNQKYFHQRVWGNGWRAMKDALQSILTSILNHYEVHSKIQVDRIFNCLLACALDDESVNNFFCVLARQSENSEESLNSSVSPKYDNPNGRLEKLSATSSLPVRRFVQQELTDSSVVIHPDALFIMFELWQELENKIQDGSLAQNLIGLRQGLPLVLSR